MPVQHGPATQGKRTHEDRASSTAVAAKSKFRDGKPENRPGVSAPSSIGVAEKLVASLGKG